MRTLEANQTTAQQQNARTPYIKLVFYSQNYSSVETWYARAFATNTEGTSYGSEVSFNTTGAGTTVDLSTDSAVYGNRILLIDHTEEPYNDYAYIMLVNNTRDIPDLVGYYTDVGYGDTYLGSNYYLGGRTSRLWVKEQRLVSSGGKLYTLLVLEGIWSFFREQLLIGSFAGQGYLKHYYDPQDADETDMSTMTIFDCCSEIVNLVYQATGQTLLLSMAPDEDDNIMDTYVPGKELNVIPYETANDLLQQLMSFCKSFLLVRYGMIINVIYPQDTDAVDRTYYSYQQHYFLSYTSNDPLVIPNKIYVFHGRDPDTGLWPDEATVITTAGEDHDQESIDAYMEVADIYVSDYISSQADANTRADAILYKTEAQLVKGELIVPHDAAVELYDKISVVDTRGT
jgi:hypothetical protein